MSFELHSLVRLKYNEDIAILTPAPHNWEDSRPFPPHYCSEGFYYIRYIGERHTIIAAKVDLVQIFRRGQSAETLKGMEKSFLQGYKAGRNAYQQPHGLFYWGALDVVRLILPVRPLVRVGYITGFTIGYCWSLAGPDIHKEGGHDMMVVLNQAYSIIEQYNFGHLLEGKQPVACPECTNRKAYVTEYKVVGADVEVVLSSKPKAKYAFDRLAGTATNVKCRCSSCNTEFELPTLLTEEKNG